MTWELYERILRERPTGIMPRAVLPDDVCPECGTRYAWVLDGRDFCLYCWRRQEGLL